MTRTRRGTCDGCGKVRKLTYPPKKNTAEHPRILPPDAEIYYYGLCSECFPKVKTQADIRTLRQARDKTTRKRYKKAYPCLGGPLDGQHAATEDFETASPEKFRHHSWYREGGMYGHLADEYVEFNAGRRTRSAPSMIFVHTSILKPVISARER